MDLGYPVKFHVGFVTRVLGGSLWGSVEGGILPHVGLVT